MDRQADCAPAVHFCCLAIKLWDLDLRRGSWVRCRDLKLKSELVLVQIVDIPALALPGCPIFAGSDGEPVRVCGFIELDVFDERLQLLQEFLAESARVCAGQELFEGVKLCQTPKCTQPASAAMLLLVCNDEQTKITTAASELVSRASRFMAPALAGKHTSFNLLLHSSFSRGPALICTSRKLNCWTLLA